MWCREKLSNDRNGFVIKNAFLLSRVPRQDENRKRRKPWPGFAMTQETGFERAPQPQFPATQDFAAA